MARLRVPRAAATEIDAIALLEGEIVHDTTNDNLRLGDGSTLGGKRLVDAASDVTVSVAMVAVVQATTLQSARQILNAKPWINILDYISDAATRTAILNHTQSADLSTYIQQACDAADDVGAAIYFPPGRYPILASITTEQVSFVGDRNVEDLYPYGSKGTVFVFTSTANTPFKLGESVSFHSIVFYWPNQIESAATWVANSNGPIVYPPLIENTNSTTTLSGLAFVDCVVLNAYDFIDVGGNTAFDKGGRWSFTGNRIFALRRYFNLNNIPDIIAIDASNMFGWNVYADELQHFSGGGAAATISATSITRSGGTATVTTASAHGLSTGQKATIAGAAQSDYNGEFVITSTGASTFTYTVGGAPATPATGTITSTAYYLRDYAINNSIGFRINGDASAGARSTYSVDGIAMAGGLWWGLRCVVDVDGGALSNFAMKGTSFDGCQQILRTQNYGTASAVEFDMCPGSFLYKYNYTTTATPAAFSIDTPAPSSGAAVTDIRVRGSISYCSGSVISVTGQYVRSVDADIHVGSIAHQVTDAGTYYMADINAQNAQVHIRGMFDAGAASSGGVNRTGIRLADCANAEVIGAKFNYCDRPINITDTAGQYTIVGCASANTGDTYSCYSSSSDAEIAYNNFDKPQQSVETYRGNIRASATNDSAAAGTIGEYIESEVVTGSAVSLTTGTAANITSISLTAGDWEVVGIGQYKGGGTTQVAYAVTSISSTSATLNNATDRQATYYGANATIFGGVGNFTVTAGAARISLSSTTTIYLVTQCGFSTSTMSAYGKIEARRMR